MVINLNVPFRHINNNIHYIPCYTMTSPPASVLIQNMPSSINFVVAFYVHIKVTSVVVIVKIMLHSKLHQIDQKVMIFESIWHCRNEISTTILMHKLTNHMWSGTNQTIIQIQKILETCRSSTTTSYIQMSLMPRSNFYLMSYSTAIFHNS